MSQVALPALPLCASETWAQFLKAVHLFSPILCSFSPVTGLWLWLHTLMLPYFKKGRRAMGSYPKNISIPLCFLTPCVCACAFQWIGNFNRDRSYVIIWRTSLKSLSHCSSTSGFSNQFLVPYTNAKQRPMSRVLFCSSPLHFPHPTGDRSVVRNGFRLKLNFWHETSGYLLNEQKQRQSAWKEWSGFKITRFM